VKGEKMAKLPSDWFVKGLESAKAEVAAWPEWKKIAMQVSCKDVK
jgi:hypothetical protein